MRLASLCGFLIVGPTGLGDKGVVSIFVRSIFTKYLGFCNFNSSRAGRLRLTLSKTPASSFLWSLKLN
jgi:hypothetical protein